MCVIACATLHPRPSVSIYSSHILMLWHNINAQLSLTCLTWTLTRKSVKRSLKKSKRCYCKALRRTRRWGNATHPCWISSPCPRFTWYDSCDDRFSSSSSNSILKSCSTHNLLFSCWQHDKKGEGMAFLDWRRFADDDDVVQRLLQQLTPAANDFPTVHSSVPKSPFVGF